MNNEKIQIDKALFYDLIAFHILKDEDKQETIIKALETKLDALVNRDLYTKSKTAQTPEEREKARQEYLKKRAIHKDWSW